jgi:hypothetical protein
MAHGVSRLWVRHLSAFVASAYLWRQRLVLGELIQKAPLQLVGCLSTASGWVQRPIVVPLWQAGRQVDAGGQALGRQFCDLLGPSFRASDPFKGFELVLLYVWRLFWFQSRCSKTNWLAGLERNG